MSTTSTYDINAALKIISQGPVVENFVMESELADIFDTSSAGIQYDQTTGGRYIERAQMFAPPGSVGARSENDYIPVPKNPEFLNSRMYLKKQLGALQMTGDTMRRVQGDEGAFLNYAQEALPLLVRRLKDSVDRQYIGWGSGVLARTASVMVGPDGDGNYAIDLTAAFGVTDYGDPFVNVPVRESIVFSSNASGTGLRNPGTTQSALILNVNPDTNVITVSCDATLAAAVQIGDYIAMGDESGTSFPDPVTGNKEIEGLLAAVDDGGIVPVYNNIDRADQYQWRGQIFDAQAGNFQGAMTEDLLVYCDDQSARRGGAQVNVVISSYSGQRGYRAAVKSDQIVLDKRSYVGSKSYAPGKGVPIFLGNRTVEMRISRKMPAQVAFGLTTGDFRRITLNQWEWSETSGAIWKQVTNSVGYKDAFWAYGYMYENLYTPAPAHNFRIDNLVNVF